MTKMLVFTYRLSSLQEHIPDPDSDEKPGGSTVVVVSIVIELQGDETK